MSKLAVLCQWASCFLKPVLAQLSFVFLFQRVELTLVSIEIVVVRLLSQMAHHLAWRVIEISWTSLRIKTLGFIARLFTWWVVVRTGYKLRAGVQLSYKWVRCRLVQINLLFLLWSLWIWWPLLSVIFFFSLFPRLMFLVLLFFFRFLCLCVAHHFIKSFCLRFIIH